MYLVSYQKRNGDVFCRIRNTIPNCGIGHETSMGWLVLDVKYWFRNGFYSSSQYHTLFTKQKNKKQLIKKLKSILKQFSISISLILILIYLIK